MITQEQYSNLLSKGFKPEEINRALGELQQEQQIKPMMQTPTSYSPFLANPQANIVEWQLDLDKEKERIFHLLRGDEIAEDENRNKIVWKETKNLKKRILNDQGVDEIMSILDFFLSKNKILSDYNEEEIRQRVVQFGRALKDLLFLKYDTIGLERKNYYMLVWELVTTVEDTYKRALHGGEKRSLREARQISQIENMQPQQSNIPMMEPKTRGILNPMRYVKGKFVY